MPIIELIDRDVDPSRKRLIAKLESFRILLSELRTRELPEEIVNKINDHILPLNTFDGTDQQYHKALRKSQSKILMLIEKELKIVPKNYYRTRWMAIGMSAFGIPIGVAYGAAIGNMGMLGVGIPIGLAVGLAVGAGMDKKALDEGRQLNVDLKY